MKVRTMATWIMVATMTALTGAVDAASTTLVTNSDLDDAEQSALRHLADVALHVEDWDEHCGSYVISTYPPFPLQEPEAFAEYDPEEDMIYVTVNAYGGYVKVKMSPSCV